MLSSPDKIKDYEIIAPLGAGGMAMLYLARRRGVGGFSRLVTIKLVHQHLIEDENVIKLFLHEARISAHVAHPNVVHVEEVGEYAGSYFIAMEYVHGVSLSQLLMRVMEQRKRLRPTLCVWLAAQIAEALHAAHQTKADNGDPLDIVHRDVSPQNVLISHTGHVKLIDFGIAKSQAAKHRTGVHAVLGKLRYMAPEQLRLSRADRRSDVYALGVMLWEMLAGRSLLRCQHIDDDRDWATREHPPAPSRYSQHSTPALDAAVLKALACAVEDRYSSALEFRAALLRADPAALQLDAPKVAALMGAMFGEELEQRRASWPSEVAGELVLASAQKLSPDELTADYVAAHSGEDEPPLPVARGAAAVASVLPVDWWFGPADVDNAVAVLSSPATMPSREHTLHGIATVVPLSAADTLRLPPVWQVWPGWLRFPRARLGARALGALALCLFCVATGVLLGSHLSSAPEREPRAAPLESVDTLFYGTRTATPILTDTRVREQRVLPEAPRVLETVHKVSFHRSTARPARLAKPLTKHKRLPHNN